MSPWGPSVLLLPPQSSLVLPGSSGMGAFFQTMGRTPWCRQGSKAHVKVDSRLSDHPSPTLGGRCWVPDRDLPGEMGGKRNKTPSALPSRSCSQRAQESGLV